jgi:hypothetical protein
VLPFWNREEKQLLLHWSSSLLLFEKPPTLAPKSPTPALSSSARSAALSTKNSLNELIFAKKLGLAEKPV